MATKIIKFTAAGLKSMEDDTDFNEFRDVKYPLRIRLHKSRETGSWYLFKNRKYKKIGNYPAVTLDDIRVNLGHNLLSDDVVQEYEFTRFGELLTWYLERATKSAQISKKRVATIRWAITKHLIPYIGEFELKRKNLRFFLDTELFQPLQVSYSPRTVKSVWVVLKQAVNRATILEAIAPTSISAMEFGDFITPGPAPLTPPLRFKQVKKIFEDTPDMASIPARALVAIMMLHGTRLGETRRSKWREICFDTNTWILPPDITKTNAELKLPLTAFSAFIFKRYKAWQEMKGYDGVYLFPRRNGRFPINENQGDSLIRQISQRDWKSHQIRRFARTTWTSIEIDFFIGELLLNHKIGKIPEAYIDKAETWESKRKAMNKYHGWLLETFPLIKDFLKCSIDAT